jgi:hypothetical protein
MQAETGGFGGLMLTTHEWTGTEKLRKSLELFARYVMPHFRGHTLGYRDEWKRIQRAAAEGGVKLGGEGQASNLVRSEDLSQAPGNDPTLMNEQSRRIRL